jgi:3-phosphoshikimate 1-carboxyvinyltransferase
MSQQQVSPAKQLIGSIELAPDKSIAQRAAIFSLLHDGTSTIENFSPAQDPQSTLSCVAKLGAKVDVDQSIVRIEGVGRDGIKAEINELDCGNSGTAMRLLSGVLVGAGIPVTLIGDPSLSSRTMTRIIKPLEQMGAHILARNSAYAPLFITREDPLVPMDFRLPIPSAQLKSCILLAGLFGEEPTRVIESIPSRDHTERLLQLPVSELHGERIIEASRHLKIPAQNYRIPGDYSAAAFWLVAGSIVPNSEIQLPHVGLNPTRTASLKILQEMGANISIETHSESFAEPVGTLTVTSSALKAFDIPVEWIPNAIDELPILAVAMAFAEGTSHIRGAEELRHKETDRIMAIAQLLQAIGAHFRELPDGLEIIGNPNLEFESATFESYHDHRIAMASAVASLRGSKSSFIHDAEAAAVSYPDFWTHLGALSAN